MSENAKPRHDVVNHSLLQAVINGDFNAAKNIIDQGISKDDEEKLKLGLKQNLSNTLINGDTVRAKLTMDLGILDDNDLKSEEIRLGATNGLIGVLSSTIFNYGEKIFIAKKIIDLDILKEEDLKNDELRSATQELITVVLKKLDVNSAKELINLGILNEEDLISRGVDVGILVDEERLKSEQQKALTKRKFWDALKACDADSAKEIMGFGILNEEDLKDERARNCALYGLLEILSRAIFQDGYFKSSIFVLIRSAQKIIDLNILQNEDFKNAQLVSVAREILKNTFKNHDEKDQKEVIDLGILNSEEIAYAKADAQIYLDKIDAIPKENMY